MSPLNLLPPTLWQSVPFKDRDAWNDWLGHHGIWHQIMGQKTKTPVLLFDDLRRENQRHAEIHDQLADALAIPRSYDLSSFDLSDRASYYSFMLTHALDSQRLQQAAGL
jgi:hypothetical protein